MLRSPGTDNRLCGQIFSHQFDKLPVLMAIKAYDWFIVPELASMTKPAIQALAPVRLALAVLQMRPDLRPAASEGFHA